MPAARAGSPSTLWLKVSERVIGLIRTAISGDAEVRRRRSWRACAVSAATGVCGVHFLKQVQPFSRTVGCSRGLPLLKSPRCAISLNVAGDWAACGPRRGRSRAASGRGVPRGGLHTLFAGLCFVSVVVRRDVPQWKIRWAAACGRLGALRVEGCLGGPDQW